MQKWRWQDFWNSKICSYFILWAYIYWATRKYNHLCVSMWTIWQNIQWCIYGYCHHHNICTQWECNVYQNDVPCKLYSQSSLTLNMLYIIIWQLRWLSCPHLWWHLDLYCYGTLHIICFKNNPREPEKCLTVGLRYIFKYSSFGFFFFFWLNPVGLSSHNSCFLNYISAIALEYR